MLQFVLSRVTDGEFIPNDFVIKFLAKEVCTQAMATEGLCGGIIFLICGFDIHNLNMVTMETMQLKDVNCLILFPSFPSIVSCANLLYAHTSWDFTEERHALFTGIYAM